MTMSIEVINNGALNLILGMERLNLIRVNTQASNAVGSDRRLSKQFAGVMKLSDAKYESYQNNMQESRNEWNRNN